MGQVTISEAQADILARMRKTSVVLDLGEPDFIADNAIPAGAVLWGVTTEVVEAVVGAATYAVGDGTDADRFGAAVPGAAGSKSDTSEWTDGTVAVFPTANDIVITAAGATAGKIKVEAYVLVP